jgi:hypothetical protein
VPQLAANELERAAAIGRSDRYTEAEPSLIGCPVRLWRGIVRLRNYRCMLHRHWATHLMAEVDEPDRHARKARHRVCSDAPKTSQSVANAEAAGGRRTAAGNATIRVSDDGRRSRFGPCRASAVLCRACT